MIAVPSFLLKRIYVTGSLRNTVGGFEFQLNNVLGCLLYTSDAADE